MIRKNNKNSIMTANQKYKESGTSQSFKQWLLNEQKKGSMKVHNEVEFKNAVGTENNTEKVKSNLQRNVLIVVGLGLVAYGVYSIYKSKKNNVEE